MDAEILHPRPLDARRLREHLRAADALACRRSLAEFVKLAWPVIEPGTPLVWGWHLQAICDHLQSVTTGDILKLIINIPPGCCKSTLVSVLWKAWEWIDRPHLRYLTGSYDEKLAMRDAVKTRDIVTSRWYRDTFRPAWRMKRDQNAKSYYINDRQGFRLAFALGGKVTGWRGDGIVLDDPLNARDQFNASVKAAAMWKYDNVLSTRVNDPRKARFVVVMQRLADDDPSGELLKRTVECVDDNGDPLKHPDGSPMLDADGHPLRVPLYQHLCLPSEFEVARRNVTSIGWTDPRTEEGELLFPKFFTRKVLDELKQALGSDGFAGQHQQRPVALDGGRFKRRWFTNRLWRRDEAIPGAIRLYRDGERAELVLLANCQIFATVDVAVGPKRVNDPTCYQVWAALPGGDAALLAEVLARLSEPESIAEAKALKVAWPRLSHFVVEKNGVGFPLIQQMHAAGIPALPIDVHGDKMVMSTSAVVMAEAGKLFVPDPAEQEWVSAWLEEVTLFPNAAHDDRVTALSLAAEQLFTGAVAVPGPATRVEPESRGLYADRGGREPAAGARPDRVAYDREARDLRWRPR